MPVAIVVNPTVVVPPEAIEWEAVRAPGPGGQNVNKVASKVRLRVDLARIVGLSPLAAERLRGLAGRRLDADGFLAVSSHKTRDQLQNLDDACAKVRALLLLALPEPIVRRPTRPSRAAKKRRLDDKRRNAVRKRLRGATSDD